MKSAVDTIRLGMLGEGERLLKMVRITTRMALGIL